MHFNVVVFVDSSRYYLKKVNFDRYCLSFLFDVQANNRTSVVVECQVVPNSYVVKVPPKLGHKEEDPLPHTWAGSGGV